MNQICQTASGESKFVSMSESYHQNLEKMQTASAQIMKILFTMYHYLISQTMSAESEATFNELKINYSICINNELKRTRTNSNCMSSFQLVPVRCLNYLRNRTRMTRITRIFTDTVNPCESVSSAQSVFNSIPSAFVGVHPRLNRMALPDEKMLAAELERTRRMLEGLRLGVGR